MICACGFSMLCKLHCNHITSKIDRMTDLFITKKSQKFFGPPKVYGKSNKFRINEAIPGGSPKNIVLGNPLEPLEIYDPNYIKLIQTPTGRDPTNIVEISQKMQPVFTRILHCVGILHIYSVLLRIVNKLVTGIRYHNL